MRHIIVFLASVCVGLVLGCTMVDLDRIADIVTPVPEQQEPEPEPEPEPEEPAEEPTNEPWDAIAYVGDGKTAVTVGTDYEGRTATLSGSVSATSAVERARATFPVVASMGDIVTCGGVTLQIVIIRERSNTPKGW